VGAGIEHLLRRESGEHQKGLLLFYETAKPGVGIRGKTCCRDLRQNLLSGDMNRRTPKNAARLVNG
jgi:hypothetical protein